LYLCLQVNAVQLYGKSRREAVAFLREVPPPFTLVCCRHLTEENSDYQHDRDDKWRSPSTAASLSEVRTHIQMVTHVHIHTLTYVSMHTHVHTHMRMIAMLHVLLDGSQAVFCMG
jgi:hypothetical protein